MTLSNTVVRVAYSGDGTTASFTVTFPFWDVDDIKVILTDANGDDTTWVRGTQYTVSGGNGSTGTVSVETTPTDYTPASGETLTILSALTLTQDVSLPLGGALPSADVEQRLDKNVRLIQQMDEKLDRAVLLPESSSNTDLTIPDPVADNILRWKSDLSGLENVATSSATILSQLNDSDNDTIINVEESADEDIVRVDIAGAQKGRWDATGLVLGTLNTAPDGDLHIFASSAGTISAHADADNLIIESSANTGLTILSGTTGLGSVHFGDSGDNDIGKITYDHSDNTMRVYVNATLEGRWDATGLNIPNGGSDVAPDGPLHIGAGLAGAVSARTDGDDLIIEAADNAGLSLLSGTANRIWFGDAANGNNKALIEARPGNPSLGFGLNAAVMLNIKSNEIVLNEPGGNQDTRMEGDTNSAVFFLDASNDHIVMGSSSGDASALLDLVSTTKGLGLPSMTTTQRDNISTPRDGLMIYNSTNNSANLRANGSWVSIDAGALQLTRESVQASTSGTSIDFTGLPSGANRITVIFDQVSLDGTDEILVQIGDSGGLETSGYTSSSEQAGGTHITSSSGYVIDSGGASDSFTGNIILTRQTGNWWIASYGLAKDSGSPTLGAGRKEVSAELDRLSIVPSGTDNFDNGNINVFVEV